MALIDPIIQFQKERASVPFQPPTLCTAETFPLLLAGVPALRKIPGLAALEDAGEAYFTSGAGRTARPLGTIWSRSTASPTRTAWWPSARRPC